MAKIARALAGFLTHHKKLRVNEAERINDYFALDGLDGVDDNRDRAGVQLLE